MTMPVSMDTTNQTRTERDRRGGVVLLAVVLGVLLSSVTILTASRAAFSDTASNEGNFVSIGDVVLEDDDAGSALFAVSNMAPGEPATACIEVGYSGSIADPGAVVVYSGGFTDSASLAGELNLTVEEGVGGDFASCAGFGSPTVIFDGTLATFDSAHSDYATGAGAWDPASTPESRTYRLTVELPTDADDSVQGQSITDLVFTWEVQS